MKLTLISKRKLPGWEFLSILYLFTIYLLPSSSVGSTMVLMLLLMYCGYIVLVDSSMLKTVFKILLLIVILASFYAVLTDAASIAQGVSNRELKRFISKVYQYTTLYFPAILFVRVNKTATEKQKKVLVFAGCVLVVYVIVSTWLFLIENPNATREWENFEENSRLDVANFYFIYAVPIIISLLGVILVKSDGALKIASVICIIIGIVFLVNAQYTLSILIAIVGILFQVFCNLRSGLSKLGFIFSMIILTLFLPQIIEFAVLNIPSEQVSDRLSEIHAFLTDGGIQGYNLSGRLTIYGNTIRAFLKSPVWGNRYLDFDGHATFLTVLSDTGLLGGIPFYALLGTVYGYIQKWIGSNKKQFKVVFLMFVMMGLTNPIHASLPLGLITWFLAPLIIQMILRGSVKNETAMEN